MNLHGRYCLPNPNGGRPLSAAGNRGLVVTAYGGGGSGGGGFDIPTDMATWDLLLSAREADMTKDESNRITSWAEVTSSGVWIKTGFAAEYAPTWQPAGPNGCPEVEFGLDNTTTAALYRIVDLTDFMAADDALVVCVARFRGTNTLRLWGLGGSFYVERRSDGTLRAFVKDPSTKYVDSTKQYDTSAYHVISVRMVSGALSINIDGEGWKTPVASDGVQTTANGYCQLSSFTSGGSNDGFDIPLFAADKWSSHGAGHDALVANLLTKFDITAGAGTVLLD